MNRIRTRAAMCLSAFLLLFGAPFVGTAAATHLSCNQTVTTSVTLDADIGPCTLNGLIVDADGITINLNGHRIFGTDGLLDTGVGVVIDGHSNVTINNGTATTAGIIEKFDAGVAIDGTLANATGNIIDNVVIQNNFPTTVTGGDFGDGVTIFGEFADTNTVSNSHVKNNGPFSGISVFGGTTSNKVTGTVISGNEIEDNASESTQTSGVRLENWTWDATVSGNEITGSALEGVALFADTQNIDVLNNEITGNGFTDATATHRKGDGIRAFARTKFHLIQGNEVTGNAGNGIRLDGPAGAVIGANDHVVQSNTATGNNVQDDPPSVPPKATPHHHDLSDGNTGCGTNTWSSNTYGTRNQTCIS